MGPSRERYSHGIRASGNADGSKVCPHSGQTFPFSPTRLYPHRSHSRSNSSGTGSAGEGTVAAFSVSGLDMAAASQRAFDILVAALTFANAYQEIRCQPE